MQRFQSIRVLAPWLLLLCLGIAGPAWAEIGHIEKTKGQVQVDGPGHKAHSVQVGDLIDESERIKTGADGEVFIRFVDDALLLLRPNTQVVFDDYKYRAGDSTSTSALRLLKGGMRFVTGLLGKLNHEQVRIRTPVATIGIRGTDFETVFQDTRTSTADAGTYTCVNDGATFLEDENGKRVNVDKGQTAFATSADLVAKGLATATQMGLIHPPPGLFRSGSFDGMLEEMKREGLNRLQDKISEKLPSQVRDLVPSGLLNKLFTRDKPAESSAEAGGGTAGGGPGKCSG